MVDSSYWLSQRSQRIADAVWLQRYEHLESDTGGITFVPGEFIAHPDDLGLVGDLADSASEIAADPPSDHAWLGQGLRLYSYAGADLAAYVQQVRRAAFGASGARPRIGLHYALTGEIKAVIPRGGPATAPWRAVVPDPAALHPTSWGDTVLPLVAVLDTGLDLASPQATPSNDPPVAFRTGTAADPEPHDIDVLQVPGAPGGGATHLASEAGHGTFISSLIERMSGGGVRLQSVRVLDPDGSGTEKTIVEGLQFLRQRHPEPTVQVINLSLGGFTDDGGWPGADPDLPPELRDQMPVALEAELRTWAEQYPDTVFVCAAGNDGQERPFWPAAASAGLGGQGASPVVVAVGSLDASLGRSWFSNWGSWVTVWTLGEEIIGEYPDGEFATTPSFAETFPDRLARWSGTSFATPIVAAEVARLALGHHQESAAHEAWLNLQSTLVRRDPNVADFDLEYDPRVQGPMRDPRFE